MYTQLTLFRPPNYGNGDHSKRDKHAWVDDKGRDWTIFDSFEEAYRWDKCSLCDCTPDCPAHVIRPPDVTEIELDSGIGDCEKSWTEI